MTTRHAIYTRKVTVPDPDGRVGVVMDGAGAAITGFESDGTPIRAPIAQDRKDRHNQTVAESEARQNLARNQVLMPWEFDSNQYTVTNAKPRPATVLTIENLDVLDWREQMVVVKRTEFSGLGRFLTPKWWWSAASDLATGRDTFDFADLIADTPPWLE